MHQALTGSLTFRGTALVLVEHVLIVLAVVSAAAVRLGAPDVSVAVNIELLWRAVLVAGVLQICLHYCDLYDLRTLEDRRDLLAGLVRALGAASVILAILYFCMPTLIIGRGVFVLA